MPMLHTDGVDDLVVTDIGSLGFAFGPGTLAWIGRKADDSGTQTIFHAGVSALGNRYGFGFSVSNIYFQCGANFRTSPFTATAAEGDFLLVAVTKATGTVAPRFHKGVYSGGTWSFTHQDGGTTTANSAAPATSARIGATNTPSQFYEGDHGIVGVWDVVLSDAEVEALVVAEADWSTVAPVALWPPSELGDAGTIQDTIGAADESSRTGTSVAAVDIPWTASGTTHERSASISATAAITAAGTFWTIVERTAAVTAAAGIATIGQRDLLRSSTVTATGAITTAGQRDLLRSASLTATGQIATTGVILAVHERSASVSATGAIATTGTFWTTFERGATVSATASLSATGQRDLHRSASLAATGGIATEATFWTTVQRSAGLTATAAIATAGQIEGGAVTHERAASLTATATIATAGVFWHVLERSTALTATAGIASVGQRDVLRGVALTATGTIATGRQVEAQRSAALVAAATIATSGTVVGLVVPVGRLEAGGSITTTEGGFAVSVNESSSGVLALIE